MVTEIVTLEISINVDDDVDPLEVAKAALSTDERIYLVKDLTPRIILSQ